MRLAMSVLLIALMTVSVYSQKGCLPINEKTGQIEYSEVVDVNKATANELYDRAQLWFVKAFNDADNVIQLDSKENGRIVGKTLITVHTTTVVKADAGFVRFSIDIKVKDGKFKYTFSDFWHEKGATKIITPGDLTQEKPGGGIMTMGLKNWDGIKEQVHSTIQVLALDLKKSMTIDEDSF